MTSFSGRSKRVHGVKLMRPHYQQGSIAKVTLDNGYAWRVRFSAWDGKKRVQKSLTFSELEYPTPNYRKSKISFWPQVRKVAMRKHRSRCRSTRKSAEKISGRYKVFAGANDCVRTSKWPAQHFGKDVCPARLHRCQHPLGFNELSFYNIQSSPTIEATHYTVWIGGSSLAGQSALFEVVSSARAAGLHWSGNAIRSRRSLDSSGGGKIQPVKSSRHLRSGAARTIVSPTGIGP